MITQEYVKSLFNYKDGKLYWKIKRNNIQIGDIAGTFSKSTGYFQVKFDNESTAVHISR